MRGLFWAIALLGALAGGAFLVLGLLTAQGAPQQAAAGAIGAGLAVVPYVLARSVEELTRPKPAEPVVAAGVKA